MFVGEEDHQKCQIKSAIKTPTLHSNNKRSIYFKAKAWKINDKIHGWDDIWTEDKNVALYITQIIYTTFWAIIVLRYAWRFINVNFKAEIICYIKLTDFFSVNPYRLLQLWWDPRNEIKTALASEIRDWAVSFVVTRSVHHQFLRTRKTYSNSNFPSSLSILVRCWCNPYNV